MAAASPHDELDGGGVWRATNPRSRGVTVESDERPLPRWPAVAAALRRRLASGVLTLDGDEHSRLHLHRWKATATGHHGSARQTRVTQTV
ncbi:hypothetical protein OsI_06854 [Oryza sativa Indica Group]|uniref:Uncharacterized protein n=1 Tax=Oryza sativa subsp. indica TaxID=39946 RepID=B8AFX2_ORYSI|nr:hypothetical protein OsI_06854 [Oryza sativa Indica Group]